MSQVQGICYFFSGSGIRFESEQFKHSPPPPARFQLFVVALCFNPVSKKEEGGYFVAQAETEHHLL